MGSPGRLRTDARAPPHQGAGVRAGWAGSPCSPLALGAARQYVRRTAPVLRAFRAAARAVAYPWGSPARAAWFVEVSGRPRRRQRAGPSCIAASIGVTSLRPACPKGSRDVGRVDVDDLRCAPRSGARWEERARPCDAARTRGSPPATSRATALRLASGAMPVGSRCPRGGLAGVGASRWLLAFPRFERASHGCGNGAPGLTPVTNDLGPPARIRQGGPYGSRRIRGLAVAY